MKKANVKIIIAFCLSLFFHLLFLNLKIKNKTIKIKEDNSHIKIRLIEKKRINKKNLVLIKPKIKEKKPLIPIKRKKIKKQNFKKKELKKPKLIKEKKAIKRKIEPSNIVFFKPKNIIPFKHIKRDPLYSNLNSLDYLPDGDISLLNKKANRFQIFVRRVAIQVFKIIRRTSWENLSSTEINKIKDFSTIHAIMDKNGNLIKVKIELSSGNKNFDLTIEESVKEGAWDNNPPKGAESEDGNIHFIFKARSWSQKITSATKERRWLLLMTALL